MSIVPYSAGLSLYQRLPSGVRRGIGAMMRPVPRQMLLGSGFQDRLGELLASERWPRQDLEQYQVKRLRVLLAHAGRSVPFYHDLFRDLRLDLMTADLRSLQDLPVLTKDIVRKEFGRLTAADSREYHPGAANTTGSTGRPLQFFLDQRTREIELASVWRHYLGNGIPTLNARIASFRGDFVSERNSGPLWRWDGRVKELTFNTYVMDHDKIGMFVEKLNQFRPEAIRGYPHSLFILCTRMEASGLSLKFSPKLVHTSSEQLPRHMREVIERAMGCSVRDWYSQSEYVTSAGECAHGSYHQTMETGIIRIQEDEWGMERLVSTGLWNMSMPFINYEVGDHVALGDDECSCGRKHLVMRSIEGRVNDVIITARGTPLSGVGVDNYYEKEVIPSLKAVPDFLKLVQTGISDFVVETYLSQGLLDEDRLSIEESFRELLGKETTVLVKELDRLPEQKKWKNIESRLSPETVSRLMEERSG